MRSNLLHDLTLRCAAMQEAGDWSGNVQPSTSDNPIETCDPNLGGSVADPTYDNPSYNIFYTGNHSQTPSLTLTILLRSWPINSYPYAILLPSGSALVVAGETVLLNSPCWCFAEQM